jgi:hypothetical protein
LDDPGTARGLIACAEGGARQSFGRPRREGREGFPWIRASPGLFFSVTTDGDITSAMQQLFLAAVQTAHLTQ